MVVLPPVGAVMLGCTMTVRLLGAVVAMAIGHLAGIELSVGVALPPVGAVMLGCTMTVRLLGAVVAMAIGHLAGIELSVGALALAAAV
mmetsp:Transcript_120194/g.322665  ORF Transcript_120194/g.322665 Transcript_120194/m.322665 type:complete len:88 (+) Transcript_120194:1419-1682(+)